MRVFHLLKFKKRSIWWAELRKCRWYSCCCSCLQLFSNYANVQWTSDQFAGCTQTLVIFIWRYFSSMWTNSKIIRGDYDAYQQLNFRNLFSLYTGITWTTHKYEKMRDYCHGFACANLQGIRIKHICWSKFCGDWNDEQHEKKESKTL